MKTILRFSMAALALCPLAGRSLGQTDSEFAKAIETGRGLMREMLEKSKAPGASVAVAVGGRIVWTDGFGQADAEAKTAATEHTRFGIGSITKSLTTALVARLADQGKVDWEAPIEKYLADWPHKGKGISLRLIAAHLSGLDDQFASGLMETKKAYTTAEAMREIVKEPLRSKPGSESFYGTGTYTVIAAVVEKVTGKEFAAAMKEHVLDPLGMKDTAPNDPQTSDPARTSFYRLTDAGLTKIAPYDPSHKRAGAGYVSTAADMAKFGAALFRDGFLKAASRELLFQPMPTSAGKPTGFALGWRPVTDLKRRPILAQPGGGPGISSVLVLWPKEDVVVAVLSNLTAAATGVTTQNIADAFIAPKL